MRIDDGGGEAALREYRVHFIRRCHRAPVAYAAQSRLVNIDAPEDVVRSFSAAKTGDSRLLVD